MPVTDESEIAEICRSLRTIAVLGAHDDEMKPAHYVPASLHAKGVRVLPVNPTKRDVTLFGERMRGSLAELAGETVDLVDVFRRRAGARRRHPRDEAAAARRLAPARNPTRGCGPATGSRGHPRRRGSLFDGRSRRRSPGAAPRAVTVDDALAAALVFVV
jgi:predicted CoA-binding protein